jgi:hypothetical protein
MTELHAAKRILEEFRTLDPEMPIQTCLLFILAAQNEGSSQGRPSSGPWESAGLPSRAGPHA